MYNETVGKYFQNDQELFKKGEAKIIEKTRPTMSKIIEQVHRKEMDFDQRNKEIASALIRMLKRRYVIRDYHGAMIEAQYIDTLSVDPNFLNKYLLQEARILTQKLPYIDLLTFFKECMHNDIEHVIMKWQEKTKTWKNPIQTIPIRKKNIHGRNYWPLNTVSQG